ncbi:HAD family hydrolase [bacterium]|jgi:HAD superfamily hydrolase (TIGR01509 family)|nr:HAD family hydrolase [bacterium]MDB4538626.1 HAD family hydrolase [bacterium]
MTGPFSASDAVLFDLDGTLYRLAPMRRRMLFELMRWGAAHPLAFPRLMGCLREFRSAREELRGFADPDRALADVQYEVPAERLGVPPEELRSMVEEWMFKRPLPFLAGAAWPGLREVLLQLKASGVRLGVFSDYAPESKLEALGVRDLFDVALAATDREVNRFKPDPRGFILGAERLGAAPGSTVYVGDRADVDGVGAEAAGMPSVILAGEHREGPRTIRISSLGELVGRLGRAPDRSI